MNISTDFFDKKLNPKKGCKFVVMEKNGTFLVFFFTEIDSHYSVVSRLSKTTKTKFVGGGFVRTKTKNFFRGGKIITREKIYYDSESCVKNFGYDRPEDEELGKKILDFIKNEVEKNN